MKCLIAGLVLAATLAAQTTLDISLYRYRNFGPHRVFAGGTYFYVTQAAYYDKWGFQATCDPATNYCYSAQYTPTGNEIFRLDDLATPPGGLQNTVLGWGFPQYKPVNITADGHFNLQTCGASNSAACSNYSSVPITTVTLTGSSATTIRFYIMFGTGGPTGPLYMHAPFGWPANTRHQYYSVTAIRNYTYYAPPHARTNDTAWGDGAIEVTIPVNTAPGQYHAGWTFCKDAAQTGCTDLAWDITVEAYPNMPLNPPASIPPLPASYDQDTQCIVQSGMTAQPGSDCSFTHLLTYNGGNVGSSDFYEHGGEWWCITGNPDLGLDLQSPQQYLDLTAIPSDVSSAYTAQGGLGHFYDAMKSYILIARWFNKPEWENCARAVMARYGQMGPGVSAAPADGTSALNASQGNVIQTRGIYPNTTYPGGYTSVHGIAAVLNNTIMGTVMSLGRFNGGNYSATWVPNKWDAQVRAEVGNQMQLNGIGWSVPSNSQAAALPTQIYYAGYDPNDGRSNGYAALMYQGMAMLAEPRTATTGSSGAIVTNETKFGFNYRTMLENILTVAMMWVQPDGTKLSTNTNWEMVGTQPFMALSSTFEYLIRYWETTHDPLVAQAIKYYLDLSTPQYSTTYYVMPGSTAAKGAFCSGVYSDLAATNQQWYVPNNGGATIGYCAPDLYMAYTLSGMYAYVYAWYWRNWGGNSGGDAYRQTADSMFAGSYIYRNADQRYGAKGYYQQIGRHDFQYLRYRLGY